MLVKSSLIIILIIITCISYKQEKYRKKKLK